MHPHAARHAPTTLDRFALRLFALLVARRLPDAAASELAFHLADAIHEGRTTDTPPGMVLPSGMARDEIAECIAYEMVSGLDSKAILSLSRGLTSGKADDDAKGILAALGSIPWQKADAWYAELERREREADVARWRAEWERVHAMRTSRDAELRNRYAREREGFYRAVKPRDEQVKAAIAAWGEP